ncbi:transposable element Tcb1 transposase [Trichonephila clavipes]|nr:transposable element Tcb1 transposase [Trichonephila clavipes]
MSEFEDRKARFRSLMPPNTLREHREYALVKSPFATMSFVDLDLTTSERWPEQQQPNFVPWSRNEEDTKAGIQLSELPCNAKREGFKPRQILRASVLRKGQTAKQQRRRRWDAIGRTGNSNKDSSIILFVLLVCSVLPPVPFTSDHAVSGAHLGEASQERSATRVSEFDRGRIVAYRNCGLLFREIDSRVGRNQITVMRICDHWMQEGATDRRGRSHPPQCTTSREDSVSAYHFTPFTQSGLSARRPLLGLTLTQNHRHLRRQLYDEKRMWAAEWI